MVQPFRAIRNFRHLRAQPREVFREVCEQGGLTPYWFGPFELQVCGEPALVEEVLVKRPGDFGKDTRGQMVLRALLGESMLTSEGPTWRTRRRIAQPAFRRPDLRLYAHQMEACARETVASWTPGSVVDVGAEMMKLALSIATTCLFGDPLEEDAPIVDRALGEVLSAYQWMISAPLPNPTRLPVGPPARYRRAIQELHQVVEALIARRRGGPPREDLLGVLLDSDLDDAALRDELVTLLLAGHETTANALTWTLVLLGQSPSAQQRLREEVAERAPVDAALDRNGLPFTRAVIDEGMRLYPPAWLTARAATRDLELGGVRLQKGALVVVPFEALHRSPRFWTHPHGFDPDRWNRSAVGADGNGVKRPYYPFGAGQRKCIGSHFALLEARIVLAVLSETPLELLGAPPEADPSVTLRPKGPVWMRVASPRREGARVGGTAPCS